MTINYCDFIAGDDTTGDGTYGNPYKTITQSIDKSVLDEYAEPGRIEIGVDAEYCKEEIMELIRK